jgi:hypothetical protein
MTMRDKISEIITDTISGGRDQRIAAVAILAALPDYAAQQARIKELEAALVNITVEAGKSNGTKERILCLGRIALKGEET